MEDATYTEKALKPGSLSLQNVLSQHKQHKSCDVKSLHYVCSPVFEDQQGNGN